MQALDDKRKSRTNCALTDIGGNDVKKTFFDNRYF
jgi:hypothetical protein